MILNCIAVDDEPLALGLVCSFVEKTPFLKLCGSFSSGIKALEMLHDHEIDLIFLDIQMPDVTGLQLARLLDRKPGKAGPRVIFTTAFNNYALEGYKVDALDYLLKPFDYEEFLVAANKARGYAEALNAATAVRSATALSSADVLSSAVLNANREDAVEPDQEYIFLKVEYQLVRVAIRDILYIEGLKDYVKVFLESTEKPILTLISLKNLEQKLPKKRFMRVHRSYIVALDKIDTVSKNSFHIGALGITVGEQYKEAFNAYLDKLT